MSSSKIDRRFFLQTTAALGVGGLIRPGFALAADEPTGKPAAGKIGDFKISLAQWSLHKALFAKELTNLDFPKVTRERFGIEAVEFVNQFFNFSGRNGIEGGTRFVH